MESFFSKLIDQLTVRDVEGLKGEEEGQLLEFKGELSHEEGGTDPWYTTPRKGASRKGPSEYAKERIFRALVAFTNAEGGWFVLGLQETKAKPPRVKSIKPLPDCHELAERLERAAQDWIDPPIPSLRCRGIEMKPGNSAGVIVCRASRSPIAPHRLYKSRRPREAYKRIGNESKPLMMREIQDLTLDRARGLAAIDAAFQAAREVYEKFVPEPIKPSGNTGPRRLLGFQVVFVPASGPLAIDRPYLCEELFDRKQQLVAEFSARNPMLLGTIDCPLINEQATPSNSQPMLRGGRRMWSKYRFENREPVWISFCTLDVMESGVVNVMCKTPILNPGLSVRWILSETANGLRIMNRARSRGGSPDAEYVMQIELRYDQHEPDGSSKLARGQYHFGLLPDEDKFSQLLGPGPFLLPQYPVRRREEFPAVLKRVLDDLYNAVGRPHQDEVRFEPE
ncbi:MAG: ATP-binding protein [bacterium]